MSGVDADCVTLTENNVLPAVLLQMDDLLNEIRQLKDELKKKDETISQLEHQLVSMMPAAIQNLQVRFHRPFRYFLCIHNKDRLRFFLEPAGS